MMRIVFYYVSAVLLVGVGLLAWAYPHAIYAVPFVVVFVAVGFHDIGSPHNVLRNYPVIGHLRYMMEFISPEIRQYFVETNQSGRPFNRETRSLIYARAKGETDTLPFGTQQDISQQGYEYAFHSLSPKKPHEDVARISVGGPGCRQPYHASRLNISAMSFGALSANAIMAFNRGARLGGFAHNTGEGGLSPYHQRYGGDLIWQVGTGYFGCRTADGGFDPEKFRETARLEQVKMIELKLSQGAKPSHGGILPGAKVNREIADTRGVAQGKDCISPPAHRTFDDPEGLLHFLDHLKDLSGGKPVGFKLCVGRRSEFLGICKAMVKTGLLPDFITVDGAEGGTGAAPVEFTDNLGLPLNEGLVFVHNCLVGIGVRSKVRIIASGKVASGFDMVTKMALGADMCNVARPMMFAVGCIQARRCNTNTCPTGITTQDPRRARALDVETKYPRVRNYHRATIHSFLELMGALGIERPEDLGPEHIYHRKVDNPGLAYDELYTYLKEGALLGEDIPEPYAREWAAARAERF